MIIGTLIGESLRTDVPFEPPRLGIRRITRADVSASAAGDQPTTWTIIDFVSPDGDTAVVADALAASLRTEGGWYADFTDADNRFVIYAGRIFRYRRGDQAGRAEAVAYGRSMGVPEHQLDWRD
ncbi:MULTISPECIES: hypothetical protein [Protofrankia]|uniref:Uncharacterized protein n=1 Tax=Candidatus Protofrankia datiscae TaxID=2716812 RepID=F8B6P6_9ACTN|nr:MULTISPECIES: hypothetical protein [Protofrankia]AEH10260.1 hypothetical protein FsymDg_2937 [Candidatus Protofrankia datiscae]